MQTSPPLQDLWHPPTIGLRATLVSRSPSFTQPILACVWVCG